MLHLTYQKQSNLIFRLIIGAFLSSLFAVNAQELDPVIIQSNAPKNETTYKPIQSKPADLDARPIVSSEDSLYTDKVEPTPSVVNTERSDETYKKEEYLNELLRQTYYQRLTTNKWSKYLHPEGWKKNVEKWRYWSQLKEYITSNQDVLVIRSTSDDPKEVVQPPVENEIDLLDSIETTEVLAIVDKKTEVASLSEEKESDPIEIIDTVDTASPALVNVTVAPWLKDKPIIKEEGKESDIEETVAESESLLEVQPTKVITTEEKEEIAIAKVQTSSSEINYKKEEEVIKETKIPEQVTLQPSPVENKTYQAPRTTIITSDPEDFGRLKGLLPWPVSGGRVTDAFGIRKNAEARGLRPENYGIDMICPSGSTVKATHSGTVLMARRQSPYDYIVTIKHGDYTSAYYYLITPYVKQGDVVESGQTIGQLRTSVAEADFHFEIWNNQERVNPQLWLQRR